jgi:hypothetical protein
VHNLVPGDVPPSGTQLGAKTVAGDPVPSACGPKQRSRARRDVENNGFDRTHGTQGGERDALAEMRSHILAGGVCRGRCPG